jgi:hypothetical protein
LLSKVKTRPNPPVEFRPHPDHAWLDEIVARDVKMVHVEQMGIDNYWMGIYFADETVRVAVTFQVGDVVKDDEGNETRELRMRGEVERI